MFFPTTNFILRKHVINLSQYNPSERYNRWEIFSIEQVFIKKKNLENDLYLGTSAYKKPINSRLGDIKKHLVMSDNVIRFGSNEVLQNKSTKEVVLNKNFDVKVKSEGANVVSGANVIPVDVLQVKAVPG